MSTTAPGIALTLPSGWSLTRTRLAAIVLIGGLVVLQLWAIAVAYPLRVTSDVPTYLALLHGMAAHPFAAQSPFLTTPGIASPHATPYILALAKLWQAIAPAGQANDPVAAGRFLGFVGIVVSLCTLAMITLYASRIAGRRPAMFTVPVLLVLFGPAHVIWATDLSLNGLLYAGFYPQNVAIALALGALLALRGSGRASLALATALTAATMVVHPFTGVLLAGLAAADGCVRAARGEAGPYRSSAAISIGFVAGTAWPAYQLNQAMSQSGLPGSVLVAACALAPWVASLIAPSLRGKVAITGTVRAVAGVFMRRRAQIRLAVVGAALVGGLAVWQSILLLQPSGDALIHTNRLALYWGEDRWRWFLMLGAGAVGLCGLVRLALRRRPLPLIWFLGCFGIAAAGFVGLPVPVWWRFLLLCQIPLAIGAAVVLAETALPLTRRLLRGTLGFSLAFKLATLLLLPTTITYFGSQLQSSYSLGQLIPSKPGGIVASDPFTSYYVPAATGRQVLTVTKAHVGSSAELDASTHGYALLHALYAAPDNNWWPAAEALWRAGVRYVLIEKLTSLAPATLEQFSTGPTPLLRTISDQRTMGRMHWRLRRVGVLVHDDPEYALYRLSRGRLFPRPTAPLPRARSRPASASQVHGRRGR